MTAARARSTFYWAMRLMPAERRAAMFAIYDLARAIDDLIDGDASDDVKRAGLTRWRAEIAALYDGAPGDPLTQALVPVLARFRLPRAEFEQLLHGFEMDQSGAMWAPDQATFDLYCRRVAASVGFLALPVFGADGAAEHEFALYLGRGLQIVNVLRDIPSDARRGRFYLPREILAGAGVDPARALDHPALPRATAALAANAEDAFARAEATLDTCNRRALWPAVAMMGAYRSLARRGFPQRITAFDRLTTRAAALRAAVIARFA